MIIARQSTARTVTVGPVLDSSGAAVTGAVVGDFKISVNGGAPAALNGSATLTHRNTGHYSLALTATDLGTVGQAEVVIDKTTDACPVKELTVVEEAVYDALFAASAPGYVANAPVNVAQFGGSNGTFSSGRPEVNASHWGGTAVGSTEVRANLINVAGSAVSAASGLLNANVTQVSGDATAADNLEAMLDGTGGVTLTTAVTGNITGNLSGSVGSVTGNVGGNVVGSVASIATGGIAAASFAANAITAAAIAADAIGASELAADAVAEIQSGLSTLTGTDVATAVWNAATASYGSAGSYGLLVETNLDAAVTTRLAPTVAGRTLDVTTTGGAGIDWGNVENPTTAVDLSGTTVSTSQAVASVSGAVGSVTGAVGSVTGNVGGNLAGSVGSVATGGITAASLAADCITAAKIATGAIDADALAADAGTEIAAAVWASGTRSLTTLSGLTVDTVTTLTNLPTMPTDWITADGLAAAAVTEIQSGVATSAALATVATYIDTEVAAIKAKTDGLTFTVASVLDVNVQRINDVVVVGTGASGDKWRA